MMLAERCGKNDICTVVHCTTVVDRDQNENPTNIANYTVTFNPCATPFTVRYQNIIAAGGQVMTAVDNTTHQNISQAFGDGSTVNLVVIQSPNATGVTFGVSNTVLTQHLCMVVCLNTAGFN